MHGICRSEESLVDRETVVCDVRLTGEGKHLGENLPPFVSRQISVFLLTSNKRPTLPTGEYSGIASEELMGRETPVVKYSLDGARSAADAQKRVPPVLDDEFAARDPDLDITREPEMVKAFRDTWHDGIHSYLGQQNLAGVCV